MTSTPPPIPRRRVLLAPLGFLVLLVAMTVFLAVVHLVGVRSARDWVRHSHDVIESAQALFIDVLDIESGTRGYLSSGDPRFLDHYEKASQAAPGDMVRLRALVSDNPAQVARADRLIAPARQRIAIAKHRVDLQRQGQAVEARTFGAGQGKASMDQARLAMADLMSNERRLLAQRSGASDRAQRLSFAIGLCVSLLATIGLGVSMVT
ncbi:MAG TPA: CHASE3 domain-containing protein, partial [Caulobacteraceae bacterium]|nr:CHASE3 domain-containing protein [Caulobacteraceae bacterium]